MDVIRDVMKDLSPLNRFIFPAPKPSYSLNARFKDASLVKIALSPRTMYALEYHNPSYESCIVYFHANACDLGNVSSHLHHLHKMLKVNVLAPEYSGYGVCSENGGMSERRAHEMNAMCARYLKNVRGYSPHNLFVFGRSIGTGIAMDFVHYHSLETSIGGVILHSPYRSIKSLTYDFLGIANVFIFERFDTYAKIKTLTSPLLIVHSKNDEVIPFSHAQDIYDACPSTRKVLITQRGLDHNAELSETCLEGIKLFINRIS